MFSGNFKNSAIQNYDASCRDEDINDIIDHILRFFRDKFTQALNTQNTNIQDKVTRAFHRLNHNSLHEIYLKIFPNLKTLFLHGSLIQKHIIPFSEYYDYCIQSGTRLSVSTLRLLLSPENDAVYKDELRDSSFILKDNENLNLTSITSTFEKVDKYSRGIYEVKIFDVHEDNFENRVAEVFLKMIVAFYSSSDPYVEPYVTLNKKEVCYVFIYIINNDSCLNKKFTYFKTIFFNSII